MPYQHWPFPQVHAGYKLLTMTSRDMTLYGAANPAPNPRRVRIFISEKGIDLPEVTLDMQKREHKAADNMARNSLGQLPVLELANGTCITESISICRYLEALHPEPTLFGETALESALVDMWIRRVEMRIMAPVGHYWLHAHPFTARLLKQHKDFGATGKTGYENMLAWLDSELADGRDGLTGNGFSMADIVLLTTMDFASFIGLAMPKDLPNVAGWYAGVAARPSAQA